MRLLRFVVGLLLVCTTMVMAAGRAWGQSFPNKPVRIVCTEPGGSGDFAARVIANGLTGKIGQPVIVENRGGAGGLIAILTVTKASPDGYTLLLYGTTIWTLPFMQDVPYDPVRDLSPITLAVQSPNILVVHPSLAANSVKELIALAKSRPGQLNYGGSGTGSSPHLAAELFKAMAGVDIVRVPYKGGAPAIADLVAGATQLMFASAASVAPTLKAGRLRALAVTTARPSALFPTLPTVAASGLPGYEATTVSGIFAPAGTPVAIVSRLNRALVEALSQADVREKLLTAGVETVGNTPAQFAAIIKSEMAKLGKVIKDAGIRAD